MSNLEDGDKQESTKLLKNGKTSKLKLEQPNVTIY